MNRAHQTVGSSFQPEWISHYLKVGANLIPVARPLEYGGNASQRQKERDREHAER